MMQKLISKWMAVMMTIMLSVSFSSCEKNNVNVGGKCNWNKEFEDYQAKYYAFIADIDNVSKCNALKQSAIAFLKKAKGCTNAIEVEAAVNSWADINCNDLSN